MNTHVRSLSPQVCGSLRVSGKLHRCSGLGVKPLCQAGAPRPQRQMGWRRPRSLSPRWGAPRAGRVRQARLKSPALAVHVCAAQVPPWAGLCLGGRRQGRLTPGGLWASAPAACAPSLAGRSSRPSHLTVLGMQVHLELLGHNHRGLQTETAPGSCLKVFPLPPPRRREI